MNSYFLHTANSNIIQSPVAFEPSEDALNGCSPFIKRFPFSGLMEYGFLMGGVYFNNWLCSVLALNQISKLAATIASIPNDILGVELTVDGCCLAKKTTSTTNIMEIASADIGSYRQFITGRLDSVRPRVILSKASDIFRYLKTRRRRRLYQQWVERAQLPPEAVPREEFAEGIVNLL